jgi:hypothetical protein
MQQSSSRLLTVIDLPDSSHFTAVLADRRYIAAVAITVLAAVVRGFSGFGSALIYIPLVSAVYEPRVAAASLLLLDFVSGIPFAVRLFPRCDWRDVMPVTIATAITMPFGAMALRFTDPVVLRWFIAVLALGLLAVLISGWRYRRRPILPVSLAAGFFAGFSGGAVQITGPAVIIYWLSGANVAAVVRANLMVFFALSGAMFCVVYTVLGLFPPDVIAFSLLLFPLFVLSMAAGAWFFRGASEEFYRRVAYAIVAAAALVSLPLFDGILR